MTATDTSAEAPTLQCGCFQAPDADRARRPCVLTGRHGHDKTSAVMPGFHVSTAGAAWQKIT